MQQTQNKNLKVAIATGVYPPDIGGPATYAKVLKNELPKHGVDVRVFTYGENKDGEGVWYVSRRQNILFRYFKFLKLLWRASSEADVLYAFDLLSVGLSCAIVKIFRPRLRFVIRVGGDRQWEEAIERGDYRNTLKQYYVDKNFSLREKNFYIISKFVLSRADKIIFNAEIIKDIYVKQRSVVKNKVFIVKNFQPQTKAIIDNGNVSDDNFLFIGRLVGFKNIVSIIQAFEDIVSNLPNEAFLEIVGDGPSGERIKNRIKQSVVSDRIIFSSKLSHDNAINKIKLCRVFVLPSYTEVNAHTVSEALIFGKKIVLTKESESGYVGQECKNIYYINPIDVDDIAKKMLAAFNAPVFNCENNGQVNSSSGEIINKHLEIFNEKTN